METFFYHHEWVDAEGNNLVVTTEHVFGSFFIGSNEAFDNARLTCANGERITFDKKETVGVLAELVGGREMHKAGFAKEVDEIIAKLSISEARDMTDAVHLDSAPRPIDSRGNAMREHCSKSPATS